MTKFNFNAPVTGMTSYGIIALNIIENTDCMVFPIGGELREKVSDKVAKSLDHTNFDPNLPSVRLYHQFSLAESIGRGQRIGFPIFELDKFNGQELAHLKSCDKLVVCSEWAKNVVYNNGISVPTYVMPLGVDGEIFSHQDYFPETFTFFSAGKWEKRKGQSDIVEAFNIAFRPDDNVRLVMSFHNIFMRPEELSLKKNEYLETPMGKAGRISFVGPFRMQKDLARVMNMTSCGVFPSRSEGWGLETLEMMSCGRRVIVTNYAGHTEYCNSQNSTIIEPIGVEPAFDNKWFFGQGNWCKFNVGDLAEKMRVEFDKGPTVNEEGIKTAKLLSWKNSANILEDIINA